MNRTLLLKSFWRLPNVRNTSYCASYSQVLKNLAQTQITVLPNGLTVATEEREYPNACLGIYIGAGSRFENKSENGATHLFEHIVFKGTSTKTKSDIESMTTNIGAKLKCSTGRDVVSYNAECMSEDLYEVTNILLESVFRNSYCESEIEVQKNIIRQEMLAHDVDTHELLFNYLHSTAFQGTRLGQTVMGPSNNISKFNAASVSAYINKMFRPYRTVIVAVGDVKHEQIVDIGNAYFDKEQTPNVIEIGPCRYTGSEIRYRDDSMEVAHVAIAVEGPSFCSDDKLIMELSNTVIGGWDRSQPGGQDHGTRATRVASSGICDSYESFNFFYRDVGLWGVQFISPREEVDDMVLVIQDEWMRMCQMITDNELIKPKNELKSKFLSKYESSYESCKEIGESVLYTGWRPPLHEIFERIDNITAKDVKNVCNKYIYDRCPVVVGIGSTECLMEYSRLRTGMYWFRV